MADFFQKCRGVIVLVFVLATVAVTKQMDEDLMIAVFGPKPQVLATVVLDAGHGGMDPGKVGVAGTLVPRMTREAVEIPETSVPIIMVLAEPVRESIIPMAKALKSLCMS